jgi:hypothetical protein
MKTRRKALFKAKSVHLFFRLIFSFLRLIPQSRKGITTELIIQSLAEELAGTKTAFLRYTLTPFSKNHETLSNNNFSNTAIVISGRFEKRYEFTLNTIKLLRERYPNIVLIFSGWADSQPFSQDLRELKVHHIVSREPEGIDPFNLLHQSMAVSEGLRKAQSLGAVYSIRLRADQRFINPNCVEYLHDLHKSYPIGSIYSKLKGRIVGISDCLSLFAYGHFPDHFHFGFTADLIQYWKVPENPVRTIPDDLHLMSKFLDSDAYTEQVLGLEFLQRIDVNIEKTPENHWKIISEMWIIIERQAIDLFWMKYRWWDFERGDHFNRHLKFPYAKRIHTTSNIHHENWMSMQMSNFNPRSIDYKELRSKSTSDYLY